MRLEQGIESAGERKNIKRSGFVSGLKRIVLTLDTVLPKIDGVIDTNIVGMEVVWMSIAADTEY